MVMDREIRWRVKYDGQQTLCHNTTSGVSGDRRCINLINWKRFSIAWPYIYIPVYTYLIGIKFLLLRGIF